MGANGSAVQRHEALHQREPDAHATSRRPSRALRLRERLEDLLEEVRLDAGAAVADTKLQVAMVVPERDVHGPGRRRELQGVREQVSDDLREPCRIRVHPERCRGGVEPEREPTLLEGRANVLARAADHLACVKATALQRDLVVGDAAHLEQVLDEPGEVVHLPPDHLSRVRRLRAALRRSLEQVEAVPDRGERVEELVREDREEVRLPPVRFAELLLDLPLAADVHGHGGDSRPSRGRGRHRAQRGVKPGVFVLAAHGVLVDDGLLRRVTLPEHGEPVRDGLFRQAELPSRLPDHLVRTTAEELRSLGVDHREDEVGGVELDDGHQSAGGVEQASQRPLRLAQRALGALPDRDVVEQDGDRPPLGVAHAEGVHVVPAAQRLGRILETDWLTRQRDPAVDLEPVRLVRWSELAHPLSGRVHEPGLPLERLVHLQEAVVLRRPVVVEEDLHDAEALVD